MTRAQPIPIELNDLNEPQILGRSRAQSELEQIMRLAPHEEPKFLSLPETADLKEAIGEAIDAMTENEQYIFNCLFIAGLSLRVTGHVLGVPKTTLAHRRDTIRFHLMEVLSKDPRVQRWLYGDFSLPRPSQPYTGAASPSGMPST